MVRFSDCHWFYTKKCKQHHSELYPTHVCFSDTENFADYNSLKEIFIFIDSAKHFLADYKHGLVFDRLSVNVEKNVQFFHSKFNNMTLCHCFLQQQLFKKFKDDFQESQYMLSRQFSSVDVVIVRRLNHLYH